MGMKRSYLSKRDNGQKKYNVDMVTAISENALNSQLRMYLSYCDWKTTVYFLETIDDKGKSVIFMLDENTDETKIPAIFELGETIEKLKKEGSSIFSELDKLDLFSLSTGTTSVENESIKIAMNDYALGFGFKLEDGIPDEVMAYLAKNHGKIDPDSFLKIVTLDQNKNSVLFKQFFKKFEVIQINVKAGRSGVTGILYSAKQDCNLKNPVEGLWSTSCSIGLDLRKVFHKDIADEAVLEKIESMSNVPNIDTVFDISQLLLDMSTLQTVNPVKIDGLDPDTNNEVGKLISEYFNRLEKAGQTIFGHVILPKPNLEVKYLFTPTVRNFSVGDKTLYFLMNFDDCKTPVIPNLGNNKDFEWSPMIDGSVLADGVMTINASKFIPLILQKFEPIVQSFAFIDCPYIKAGAYKIEILWKQGSVSPLPKFATNIDQPWKTNWSFHYQNKQGYEFLWAPPLPFPVASAKIDYDYNVNCHTEFGTVEANGVKYPSYDFVIEAKGWINFGYNSQDNAGYFYNRIIRFQVGFKVDGNGNFVLVQRVINTNNNPKGVTISAWGTFCTAGQLEGVVRDLTRKLDEKINRLVENSKTSFLKGENTFTGWFLPGCHTFTYKNEGISEYGDFYSHVNYVQETN